MPLFRALAKNMAPMTNADESPTNRLTLFPIYLSLFIVSTLCRGPYTQKRRTCSRLMKTGMNNVVLPTVFNVVNTLLHLIAS